MHTDQAAIDFTHARSALAVRQSVAEALGIPLDQELTWDILRDAARASSASLPIRLLIEGLPRLGVVLPDEARMVRELLKDFRTARSDMKIHVTIHD